MRKTKFIRIAILIASAPAASTAGVLGIAGTMETIVHREFGGLLVALSLLSCVIVWAWFLVDTAVSSK